MLPIRSASDYPYDADYEQERLSFRRAVPIDHAYTSRKSFTTMSLNYRLLDFKSILFWLNFLAERGDEARNTSECTGT